MAPEPPNPPELITLYRGFDLPSQHVWSPFVNKLELRLRLSSIPYRIAPGSMSSAPRGKIPYILLPPPSNELLGDSTLIIARLVSDGVISDLNASLPPSLVAFDLSLRALVEDKMQFFLVRERWVDNYYAMRAGALAGLSWVMQRVVGPIAYRAAVRTLDGQGAGRYSEEEARGVKAEVWRVLGGLLAEAKAKGGEGREPFWVLGGKGPTEADAIVWGCLVGSLVCEA